MAHGPKDLNALYKRMREVSASLGEDAAALGGLVGETVVLRITQNALAAFVQELEAEPRSPQSRDPNFDLAWERDDVVYVAEVKSLTLINQEQQLRLGLGQVLRFRHLLEQRSGRPTVGVLALERKPADDAWMQLCNALGIIVVWKGEFSALAV